MITNKLILGLLGIFFFLLSSSPLYAQDDVLIGGIGYEQDPEDGMMYLTLKDITFNPLTYSPIPWDGIGESGDYVNDYIIVIGDYSVQDGEIVPIAGGDMFSFSLNALLYTQMLGVDSPSEVTQAKATELSTALDALFSGAGLRIPLNPLLPTAMIQELNDNASYNLSYLRPVRDPARDGSIFYGDALGLQPFYFDYTAPLDEDDVPEPIEGDPDPVDAPGDPDVPVPGDPLSGPGFEFDGGLFEGCSPDAGIESCFTALGSNAHILAIGLGVVSSLFMLPLIGLNLSSGDPATIQKGKDMFMSWIQGLFLIILSGVIVRIVLTYLFCVL